LEEIERIEIWFVGRKPPNSYQKRWKNLKKWGRTTWSSPCRRTFQRHRGSSCHRRRSCR
jgi:hypothetical protein